jgi:multimeric flavodoxin WrbA
MKVLGIVGSKRKHGNTSCLVQEALKEIKKHKIETELIFLGDYTINDCIGCEGCKDTYKCVIKDDMQKIYPLLSEADAIILGSPTYFYNVTADVKAFIDRCYCYEVFAEDDRSVWVSTNEALGGKFALVIAICEQHHEKDMGFTAETMTLSLESLGYRVTDTIKVLELFKKDAAKNNQKALDQVKQAGKKLYKTMELKKEIQTKLKSFKNS